MKTLKIIALSAAIILASALQAQISVNVQLGAAPQWGPVGYTDVRYYYLPDVETYYDVQNSMFIYYNGRKWVRQRNLPRQYRNYDLYNGYKVVINDYNGNSPYKHHKDYKHKYYKGYRGKEQKNIGQRPEHRNSNVSRSYKSDNERFDDKKSDKHSNNKHSNHDNGKNKKKKHD